MSKKVLVETSARHIHLTDEAVAALYGADAKLEVKKMLSQPGQFATANEKLKVVGPKGELMLSVLGPTRKANQVELSFTDARALGLKNVPVRESGDVAGTPGVKLVGPAGEIEISEGCIIAKRHIHFDTASAEAMGIKDKQPVRSTNCHARSSSGLSCSWFILYPVLGLFPTYGVGIACVYSTTVTFITTSSLGRSAVPVATFCIFSTTSRPLTTSPNTVYWLSRNGVPPTVV